MNVKKNKKGFTLMEMLIVVAIIAVLVAIAIPVLSNNLHKAKVAADWANVRAFYASLQADYLMTGEHVQEYDDLNGHYRVEMHFYNDGKITQTVHLQEGGFAIQFTTTGYHVLYDCRNYHKECQLVLGTGD